MAAWEDLRKQARRLENEVDLKLVAFSKLSLIHSGVITPRESDTEPLLSLEDQYESSCLELEHLLKDLATLNDRMDELCSKEEPGGVMVHTLQRHREILQDYKLEFQKTKDTHKSRKEREELLQIVRKDIDTFKSNSNNRPGNSGLSRRMDIYMKEQDHIVSSNRLVDEQISIAVETKENLLTQRINMKKLQTRMHDFSSRFPMINNLIHRIQLRRRLDSVIIGTVVALCTFLLLWYTFH